MNTQVITVTSRCPVESYYYFAEWKKSLRRLGVDPTVLGWGAEWSGLMTKPKTLHKWLTSLQPLSQLECLIVVDSWDLVFAKHPEVIAKEWDEIGRPFVIGGERALFPSDLGEKAFPECASSYRFPNSGFIISTPQDMIAVLEAMDLPNQKDDYILDGVNIHGNDQLEYQRVFLQQPVTMRIDSETRFVWNLCSVDDSNFDWSGSIPRNRETGNAPGVFHANGGAKGEPEFARVLRHLRLRPDLCISE